MAVLNLDFYKGNDIYSDGSIEDELLEIVAKNKTLEEINEVLKNDSRFEIFYHLSPIRKNILSVMDLDNKACLEIGSGCGALTGGIANRAKSVDAIELSKKRSMINMTRNTQDNIKIYVGNFSDCKINEKYDCILLIGVLEYGSLYLSCENPYLEFLKHIYSLLKEDGILYIAIENKLGLKYFSGCAEDHTGNFFEGIEGYKSDKVKTFTDIELKQLVKNAGFKSSYFYYPVPDYKLPIEIFSEDLLPQSGSIRNIMNSFDRDRFVFFNDELAFDSIITGGHFETFANSFLIECRRDK